MRYFKHFNDKIVPDLNYPVDLSFSEDQAPYYKGYCPECDAPIVKYKKLFKKVGVCKNNHSYLPEVISRYGEAKRFRIERNELTKLLWDYQELGFMNFSADEKGIVQRLKGVLDKLDEYAGIIKNTNKQSKIEALEELLKELKDEK